MSAISILEDVELVCENDGCPAIDVDQEPGRTPRVLRHRWTGRAVFDDFDREVIVVESPDCEHCGHPGEVGE
jgi:hypothetical protein